MNKIIRALSGSIGIIITVAGILFLYTGIYAMPSEVQNPKLFGMMVKQITIGAIMVVVGFSLFGISAGALKRPLYFLIPIIITVSFVLALVLLPESIVGIKGEGALLITLVFTILTFRVMNRYYSKREQSNPHKE